MAIFTKKGKKFDTTGKVLYGPVRDEQRVQGLRRQLRGATERRRRRALRSARRSLADRAAAVLARTGAARSSRASRAGRASAGERAWRRGSAGPGGDALSAASAAAIPRAAARCAGRPPARPAPAGGRPRRSRRPAGSVLDVLRDQHARRIRWARTIATNSCARSSRTIRGRRSGRTATTCRRARATTASRETVATQKHACVVDRAKMLKGEPATEQCVIIENVNFLNNADLDGKTLPPAGAPNIMIAAGGRQLDKIFEDNVDQRVAVPRRLEGSVEDDDDRPDEDPRRAVSLPVRRAAHELRAAAGHRAAARRAGRQDHGAARLSPGRRSRVDRRRALDRTRRRRRRRALVRVPGRRREAAASRSISRARTRPTVSTAGWRAPAIDKFGNIGIGYSFGGAATSPGQRFAGAAWRTIRSASLTLQGDGARRGRGARRRPTRCAWEDYTQTADRSDRRLHDLVRRRLRQEGRDDLLDEDWRVQDLVVSVK